jgi:hypothetical protein
MLTVRPQSKVCLTLCNFRFERLGCTKPYKNDLIAWLTKPKVLYAQLRKGCFACKSKICSQPSKSTGYKSVAFVRKSKICKRSNLRGHYVTP